MLRPRKRITKKEIKEDPLVTNYLKVQNWLKKHSKQINIAIGGIIVVLLIVLIAVRSKRQAEIKAESQLSVVEQFYYQMDYNKVVQQMPEIIDKYRGTRAAGEAAFFVANSYYNLKDYDNSIKYFTICYKTLTKDPIYAPSSYAGIAQSLEMQEKYSEAAAMFEKAASEFDKLFSAPFYFKSAARCFAASGDSVKAKQILQKVIDNYPSFEFKNEVLFQLKSLGHS